MKLVYWCAPCRDDGAAYNIRARTRKEANEKRVEFGVERFDKPTKVTIEYKNAFDLIDHALGEGGIVEPYATSDDTSKEEKED